MCATLALSLDDDEDLVRCLVYMGRVRFDPTGALFGAGQAMADGGGPDDVALDDFRDAGGGTE